MSFASRTVSSAVVLALSCGLVSAQTPPPQKSRDLKYEETVPTNPSVAIPHGWALIVGISTYKNLAAKDQLAYAARDAQSIYSILISPEGGNFHAENVHMLIGDQATLANIRHELEVWLPSVAKPDDRVVIYFAGHGFLYGGRGYLAPYDIDPKNIEKTGYSMDTVGQVAGGKIKARWKVMLTDSCHSGAITPDDVEQLNHDLLDLSKSMFLMTASRDRERSYESPQWGGGHGIFTYYVVKGLEGEADENGDGIVTADELADYVHTNVREVTKGQQNPTSDRGSFDPNMMLAFLPAGLRSAKLPAPKDGTLVFETKMDGAEVFVDGISRGVVSSGTPLRLPGLKAGNHTIQAVKMGYEPDGPRDEMVYPGRESTVTLFTVQIPRRRPKAALDELNKGLEFYNKGFKENYLKAVDHFQKALEIDPKFSQADLYLGRTYNALFDEEKSEAAFRKAIEIDPDYLEARISLAGMLLDKGATDESIRQLNVVVQRDPNNATALYMQAQAYRMKSLFAQSIDSARKSIQLAPQNAEPHLWLADSLRLSKKYQESVPEYTDYLKLSDFDSKLAGRLNYYVVGFLVGMGKKTRAAQTDTWRDMRSLAYFGLCDSERAMSQFDAAIPYCQKSLAYDAGDPLTHYGLALCYEHSAVESGNIGMLDDALRHFEKTVELNPDLKESAMAKANIRNIDSLLDKAVKQ